MNDYLALMPPPEKVESVKRVAGRTVDEILSKESHLDVYAVLGAIDILVGAKICRGCDCSHSERIVFAFSWLAREVGTGGFQQYFINSAGDFWRDVEYGLKAIRDEAGLELFLKAISIFPSAAPSDERETRLQQLSALEEKDDERLSEHLNSVTAEYFSNPFPNWNILLNYVKSHKDEFDFRNV